MTHKGQCSVMNLMNLNKNITAFSVMKMLSAASEITYSSYLIFVLDLASTSGKLIISLHCK